MKRKIDGTIAKNSIVHYFKKHGVAFEFEDRNAQNGHEATYNLMYFKRCADSPIETCIETRINFREESMCVQSYYCKPIANNEEERVKAQRYANYVNWKLSDFTETLYVPSFFVDEDGVFYIYYTVRYELFGNNPQATVDYILDHAKRQFEQVCVPLAYCISNDMQFEDIEEQAHRTVIDVRMEALNIK